MASYPGGKAGGGAYQTIINQIPPHKIYVEGCLGGGAIMRYKRPGEVSYAFELDLAAIEAFDCAVPGLEILQEDVLKALWRQTHRLDDAATMLYLDPPYVMATRKGGALYKFEWTDEQHQSMLAAVQHLPCRVVISGYWSEMYAEALKDWRAISFWAVTRSGKMAEEWLWMNYPDPVQLHDYRYLGARRGPRQAKKRKAERWRQRAAAMAEKERMGLVAKLKGEGALFEPEPQVSVERAAVLAAVAGVE